MNDVVIYEDESLDDLNLKGFKIIQKNKGFRFGIDAVVLSHFADVKKSNDVLDLGTGTGVIPILLAGKTKARSIIGIEIQDDVLEMAQRSVRLNKLEKIIEIQKLDIKLADTTFKLSSFDVIVSNPPYTALGKGLVNISATKTISRHEVMCKLEDIIRVASKLLKTGGQFAMVHRPDRLVDIFCLMRKYAIEPKYLQFVHPTATKKASLILVKGNRSGSPELKLLPPLIIYNEDGSYTNDINNIYNMDFEEK